MDGLPLAEAAIATAVPKLSLIPSDPDLAGIEFELASRPGRATRLRDAITAAPIAFDYVLIDCPPSLNLLTLNALTAADGLLAPLQCEFFALEGLTQLLRTLDQVRGSLNPKLALHGVVLTMYDRRNGLSAQVERDVRDHLGDAVYRTVIPAQRPALRSAVVRQAGADLRPALRGQPGLHRTWRPRFLRRERALAGAGGRMRKMAENRRGLGRGLSALIEEANSAATPEARSALGVRELMLDIVHRNPEQPRRAFGEDDLRELTDSVRERGVISPIVVRPAPGKPGGVPDRCRRAPLARVSGGWPARRFRR